jgi:glycosyltransferase involved in cell wall biosynthesis
VADPSTVSIVIPAFNERESIAEVIGGLRAAASWREIIVVDDASTDGTGERAAAAGATVVRHAYNIGNGAAVKNGIRRASGDYVLIVDADGQQPPGSASTISWSARAPPKRRRRRRGGPATAR